MPENKEFVNHTWLTLAYFSSFVGLCVLLWVLAVSAAAWTITVPPELSLEEQIFHNVGWVILIAVLFVIGWKLTDKLQDHIDKGLIARVRRAKGDD